MEVSGLWRFKSLNRHLHVMEFAVSLFDRSRHLLFVALGLLFAVSGVLAAFLSGEDLYSLVVGVVFFLVGSAIVIFAERVNGNI
jgi:hypothetical protein